MRALSSSAIVNVPFLLIYIFFFNDTATTEIYTLSLHDALPISCCPRCAPGSPAWSSETARDRKSTRLNSSHSQISYAVFCLKKKKKKTNDRNLKKKKNKKNKKVQNDNRK